MAGQATLVFNCPHCGKPCSCRLQGGAGTSWFACPHCRTKRFYVQVTVGREAGQAAAPRPEQVPALRRLTEEFDWDNPQDFVRFAQAYAEDLATLARLKPGPVVTAAKKQLETMRFAVRNIEGTRLIQAGAAGLALLPPRMEQAGRTAGHGSGGQARAASKPRGLRGQDVLTWAPSAAPPTQAQERSSPTGGSQSPTQASGYGCVIVRVGTDTVVVRDQCERCGHVDGSTRHISKPSPNSRITGAFTCFKCGAHQDWAVKGS